MKSKKKKIILSILLTIILLLISFSVYYVIDYNKGKYTTYLKHQDGDFSVMPIPKWSKVIADEGMFILKIKSYLKQEEIEKFYNDVFYSKAKKIVSKTDYSKIAYYDPEEKMVILQINYRIDERYTICNISYDFMYDEWKIVE